MTRSIRFLAAGLGGVAGLLLTAPVVLASIPFWLVSGLSGAILRVTGRIRAGAVPWTQMVVFDPEIGWRPKGGLNLTVRGERTVKFTTDADGWRGRATLEDADVVVIGDSFAFGHGTDNAAFFADRVPGCTVKAIGADGYNLVQELQWMERLGSSLRGKLVVWLVYYGNDLYDNMTPHLFGYRQPFVREARDGTGWEIVTEHVREEPWRGPKNEGHLEALAGLSSSTYQADRAFSATEAILTWGRDLLRRLGAGLVVVGHPDPAQVDPERVARFHRLASEYADFDVSAPDRKLAEMCARAGIRFESFARRVQPSDFLLADVHWTPAGNARMASLIEDLAGERSTLVPNRDSHKDVA